MKKKLTMLFVAVMMTTMSAMAQLNFAGRTYHCGNLMGSEMNELKKEANDIKKEAETAEEKEEVKGLDALMDAIASTMTLKFIDDKTVEVSVDVKFDEAKAKQGGASWMMRKIVRLKMGKGYSKNVKGTYTVSGRNVNVKGNDKDQVYVLSEDGKSMTYQMKKKKGTRTVVLKRIK